MQDQAAASGSTEGTEPTIDYAEESADRALRSVSGKLDKSLSVEYTVNQLITAATNPSNLSRIYSGGWISDSTEMGFADKCPTRLEPASMSDCAQSKMWFLCYCWPILFIALEHTYPNVSLPGLPVETRV